MFTRIIFVKKRGVVMSNLFVSSTGVVLNLDHVMSCCFSPAEKKNYILFRDGKEGAIDENVLEELRNEIHSRRTMDTLKWIAGGCFIVIGLAWWTKE